MKLKSEVQLLRKLLLEAEHYIALYSPEQEQWSVDVSDYFGPVADQWFNGREVWIRNTGSAYHTEATCEMVLTRIPEDPYCRVILKTTRKGVVNKNSRGRRYFRCSCALKAFRKAVLNG